MGVPEPVRARQAADHLARLGAATVHEAQGRRGALPSRIRCRTPLVMRLSAPVLTVATGPGENLTLHRALNATPPGWALFVATELVPEFGYWGGVMNTAARARGLAGLVIDGGVRDSAELAEVDFPVFSAYVSLRGTGKSGNGSFGSPVTVGDVLVRTGDIVVADDDGVVIVDQAEAGEVAVKGCRRDADEAAIMERLRLGESTLDVYGWDA
jgi:4-hydroxy-4-methyl-2-oxoglutarate aldolase